MIIARSLRTVKTKIIYTGTYNIIKKGKTIFIIVDIYIKYLTKIFFLSKFIEFSKTLVDKSHQGLH